jgi:uncharacterized RDD family membrane protein YckC
MKNKTSKRILQLGVATLSALWLACASLPAQDNTDEATNTDATTNETDDAVKTKVNNIVSNALATAQSRGERKPRRHRGGQGDALVQVGQDSVQKEGETNEAVVAINGNAIANGRVRDAVVAIGGNATVNGEVGDAVVAVLGGVKLGSNATVHGDVVSIGGGITREEGAVVEGEIVPLDFQAVGLPHPEPLAKWFRHCVLPMRPLAPQVGGVWVAAVVFLLVYLLVAVALPRPVAACVDVLTRRPITAFFVGPLFIALFMFVMALLAIIVVGLVVVPFIIPVVFFGAIVGKAAILEYLGLALGRAFGTAQNIKPVIALLIGAAVLTVLYNVPIVGLMAFAVTGLWGLGAAVMAAFGGMKREAPEKPTPPPAAPTAPPTGAPPSGLAPMPVAGAPAGAAPNLTMPVTPAPDAGATQAASAATLTSPPPAQAPLAAPSAGVPEAFAYPHAGFWERMGAAFLDVVLVGILSAVANNFMLFRMLPGPTLGWLIALAYFAGMWPWKGTTVGGIVLNLKVVRLDGSHLTFAAALVRALSAAFSIVVFFLGFLWIAWDKEKQGWHDRIAGTVVIRLPRGTPLVVL